MIDNIFTMYRHNNYYFLKLTSFRNDGRDGQQRIIKMARSILSEHEPCSRHRVYRKVLRFSSVGRGTLVRVVEEKEEKEAVNALAFFLFIDCNSVTRHSQMACFLCLDRQNDVFHVFVIYIPYCNYYYCYYHCFSFVLILNIL